MSRTSCWPSCTKSPAGQTTWLGTATPIQTRAADLWDLVGVLHRGSSGFVLGNDLSPSHNPGRVLPIMSGEERVDGIDYGWQLLRSPLPTMESTNEPNARRLFRNLPTSSVCVAPSICRALWLCSLGISATIWKRSWSG